jgi:hypothetical protein
MLTFFSGEAEFRDQSFVMSIYFASSGLGV